MKKGKGYLYKLAPELTTNWSIDRFTYIFKLYAYHFNKKIILINVSVKLARGLPDIVTTNVFKVDSKY